MEVKNAICLVVDRFHAGMLGPYGNTWIRTPGLDRLASESFVFDQAFTDTTCLETLYRAYWHGIPAASRVRTSGASLVKTLADAGVATAIMSDDPAIARLPEAADFAEQIEVETSDVESEPADEESQTGLGRFFTAAAERLAEARTPFLLWLHTRGLASAWDAPLELRNQYIDEEDPLPPATADVPCYQLAEDADPDEVMGHNHAYAGQVSLLDICLGALVDQLSESGLADNTLIVLVGARGFPLGEHGQIGTLTDALYNETVQVPWLARFPDGLGKLSRSQALVTPADLPATLLDWWGIGREAAAGSLLPIVRGEQPAVRDHVAMVSPQGEWALRTPAWLLKLGPADANHPDAPRKTELFAKPSDRWEVNEVADRCPEIAAGLTAVLVEIAERGEPAQVAPLAEPLVTEFD